MTVQPCGRGQLPWDTGTEGRWGWLRLMQEARLGREGSFSSTLSSTTHPLEEVRSVASAGEGREREELQLSMIRVEVRQGVRGAGAAAGRGRERVVSFIPFTDAS